MQEWVTLSTPTVVKVTDMTPWIYCSKVKKIEPTFGRYCYHSLDYGLIEVKVSLGLRPFLSLPLCLLLSLML